MWEEIAAVYEVRTFADPASVSDLLRQAVQTTSPAIPPIETKTMSGLVDQSPVAMLLAAIVLVAIATLAAVLPAHRASRVDPIIAPRYE